MPENNPFSGGSGRESFSQHSATNPEQLFALANGQEESFPVLKAFQDFLEQERARARKRVWAIVLSFVGVLVAVVILFAVLFVAVFGVMLRNNDRQQEMLLNLMRGRSEVSAQAVPVATPLPQAAAPVATAVPAPAAPVVAPAPAPAPTDSADKLLSRNDLLEILRTIVTQPGSAAPAPVAPVAPVAEPVAPVAPVAEPAPRPAPLRGVISPVSKAEQMARLQKEEEERKARAAERRAAAEAAAAAATAEAVPAPAEPEVAADPAPVEAPAADSAGDRVAIDGKVKLSERRLRSEIPGGKEADVIHLETPQGVIPFRSLLPTTAPVVP